MLPHPQNLPAPTRPGLHRRSRRLTQRRAVVTPSSHSIPGRIGRQIVSPHRDTSFPICFSPDKATFRDTGSPRRKVGASTSKRRSGWREYTPMSTRTCPGATGTTTASTSVSAAVLHPKMNELHAGPGPGRTKRGEADGDGDDDGVGGVGVKSGERCAGRLVWMRCRLRDDSSLTIARVQAGEFSRTTKLSGK